MSDWYYHAPGQGRVGPLAAEALRDHFDAGRIRRDTLVWREGMAEWQPLENMSVELGIEPAQLYAPPPPQPPPLPPTAASASMHAQSIAFVPPPKKSGLSGCLIALIVIAVVAVPAAAILAAIAIPAYQDYTLRAKVAEAAVSAEPVKLAVAEFQGQHQACPDNASAGFKSAEAYAGPRVASIAVGTFDNDHCGIELRLRGTGNERIDGKALWWEYDGGQWRCSSEIDDKYLPRECRGG